MGANYGYNCKCLADNKEETMVNFQEDQQAESDCPKEKAKAMCEEYIKECPDSAAITTIGFQQSNSNSNGRGNTPVQRKKDKTKSELLKIPLEIINELRQEEVYSPTINTQGFKIVDKFNEYDFELEIHKVQTTQTIKSEDKKTNHGKSKSFVDQHVINTTNNVISSNKNSKVQTVHRKTNSISQESWKNFSISMIVPQKKLISSNYEEILLQGEIFKYVIDENIPKFATNYSQKFFIVNKKEFCYYKSKESFLRLQTPLGRIPVFQIKKVEKLSSSTKEHSLNKQFHHLKLELFTENCNKRSFLENIDGLSRINRYSSKSNQASNNVSQTNLFTDLNDRSLNLPSLLKEMNHNNTKNKQGQRKPNKISLIKSDHTETNDKNNNLDTNINMPSALNWKGSLFIFADKNPEFINKIIFLINYLRENELI